MNRSAPCAVREWDMSLNRYFNRGVSDIGPSCDAPSGELMVCPVGSPCLTTGSIDTSHTAEAGRLYRASSEETSSGFASSFRTGSPSKERSIEGDRPVNSIQVIAVEAALAVFAVGVLIWALKTRGAASIAKAEAELEAARSSRKRSSPPSPPSGAPRPPPRRPSSTPRSGRSRPARPPSRRPRRGGPSSWTRKSASSRRKRPSTRRSSTPRSASRSPRTAPRTSRSARSGSRRSRSRRRRRPRQSSPSSARSSRRSPASRPSRPSGT